MSFIISGAIRSWEWCKSQGSAHVIKPENLSGHKVQNFPKKGKPPSGFSLSEHVCQQEPGCAACLVKPLCGVKL